MRIAKRFITGVAVLLAALVAAGPATAQEPVVVRVAPGNLSLAVGGTSDVAVEIVDVVGLYGFDVQLSFDPAKVEVVDADPDKPGVQVSLGRMLDSGMSVREGADNVAGTIHYAMTQLNPSEAKSGTGNLIVIKLRGKAAGTTNLTITSVDLARRDASAIPSSLQSGAVTVSAGAATQATNTPIPTQAPPTAAPTGLPAPPAAPAVTVPPTATDAPLATATLAPPTATRSAEVVDTPTTAAEPAVADPTAPPSLPDPTTTTLPPDPTATAQVEATAIAPAAVVNPEATSAVALAQPNEVQTATPEPTATSQAVSVAPVERGGTSGPAPSTQGAERTQDSNPEGLLLTVGIAALLAAVTVGVILLILLMRRRTAS